MKKLMKRGGGFTLIELMIVILIIAILVAIAVPVYLNARKNAQKRTCQANLRTVDGAIQSYQAMFDTQQYPDVITRMTATSPNTKVLKEIPECPKAGSDYELINADPPWISCPNDPDHTI